MLTELRAGVCVCLCTGLEGRVRQAVWLCGCVWAPVYSRVVCCWLNSLFLFPQLEPSSLEPVLLMFILFTPLTQGPREYEN